MGSEGSLGAYAGSWVAPLRASIRPATSWASSRSSAWSTSRSSSGRCSARRASILSSSPPVTVRVYDEGRLPLPSEPPQPAQPASWLPRRAPGGSLSGSESRLEDKLKTLVLRVFQAEVELQCKTILHSWHQLQAALITSNNDEAWKELQVILVSAANLSKMFWGSGGRREEQRARLRDSLQVVDTSPLRDPNLRNDFEHFDERLEDWYSASERHNIITRAIGPYGMPSTPSPEDWGRFHHYASQHPEGVLLATRSGTSATRTGSRSHPSPSP